MRFECSNTLCLLLSCEGHYRLTNATKGYSFFYPRRKKTRTVINYKKENELHNSHTSPVTYLYTTKDEHTVLLKDIEGMNNCRKCIKTSHMEEENQEETENVNKKHD